jgi:hypothetical protein
VIEKSELRKLAKARLKDSIYSAKLRDMMVQFIFVGM